MNTNKIILISLLIGVLIMSLKPRGIRNNNPLNIRDYAGNEWQGKTGTDDKGFVVFDNAENGIRAAKKILQSYAKRGITTLESIVETWAPKMENPTRNYITFVARILNKPENAQIVFSDYAELLSAMTFFENGDNPYPIDVFNNGVARV